MIRNNPQFTLLYMGNGIYIIGMKNQFSSYDLVNFDLKDQVRYISDETCHILYQNQNLIKENI
jgi:hypothetical protein